MPDTTAFAVFLAAALALNLTPGPDMLYVIANSVAHGRRGGVVSALGIGAGTIVHTVAAALGLSALLMSSALAFSVVRYLGAIYLLYLGARAIAGRKVSGVSGDVQQADLGKAFRQGVITNVLNPKVALFFLAFIPQFVNQTRGSVVWQFLLLGTIFNCSGTIVNTIVAWVTGYAGDLAGRHPRLSQAQRYVTGTILVALGARMALIRPQ